jgi:hypothetical protein
MQRLHDNESFYRIWASWVKELRRTIEFRGSSEPPPSGGRRRSRDRGPGPGGTPRWPRPSGRPRQGQPQQIMGKLCSLLELGSPVGGTPPPFAELPQPQVASPMCGRQSGLDRWVGEGLPIAGDGLIQSPLAGLGQAQIVVSLRIVRVELEGLSKEAWASGHRRSWSWATPRAFHSSHCRGRAGPPPAARRDRGDRVLPGSLAPPWSQALRAWILRTCSSLLVPQPPRSRQGQPAPRSALGLRSLTPQRVSHVLV